jgi:arylsulfatase A-like enzyme
MSDPTSRLAQRLWFIAAVVLVFIGTTTRSSAAAKPNVLFIAIDDQNDWIHCLGGHPLIKTPNIDRLAERGTLFLNAHCQAPLCNSSRASLLTGLRPSTTGIYGLQPGIRDVERTKNHVTLPQTFTSNGYFTYTCGKIYHDGSIKPADRAAEFNVWGPAPGMPLPPKKFVTTPMGNNPLVDWGVFPDRDDEQPDWKIASAAVDALNGAPKDKPFFVACGFRLPHVPCFATQKWFDLYPDDQRVLPEVKDNDRDDTPRFSWYLHWYLPEPRLKFLREQHQWIPLVRAYLACTSFVDSQVGRVLDALDASGRAKDTIVVLWSDHGWHLGEKLITGKNSLWERSTHVPLIFAGPGAAIGAKCARTVELLDIFPTLLDLCGFAPRADLEGHSVMPLLRHSQASWTWPAITTHNQGNHSVRTEQWRFIHYADGSEELYNLQNDPNEWTNLAGDPKLAQVKRDLAKWLPKIDKPPAPHSRDRVLTYDSKTGAVNWEGKSIEKNDPIPD